jgi:hypothetical protein
MRSMTSSRIGRVISSAVGDPWATRRVGLTATQPNAMWGLCPTGVPGSGKSAVLRQLDRSLSRSDAFQLAHAPVTCARAPSVEDMLHPGSIGIQRIL